MSLALHTRYRIGGPAVRFGRPETESELVTALADSGNGGHFVLGWGANVLVSDRGVRRAVLILSGQFGTVELEADALEVGAAAGIAGTVGEARRTGRTGFAFLEAVPGTIGGALRMNAGSATEGIWDRVIWADAVTPDGKRVRITPQDAKPVYRGTGVPADWVFVAARLTAPVGDPERVKLAHLERRRSKVESQVYELPSCGSTWKNPGPPHGSAWEVLSQVGMRGVKRGGARISAKHANFIVNEGEATAEDVVWLMRESRRRVHEELGIWLAPEIQLWGFEEEELKSLGVAA
ncbi:MAG: UDP-N-acetylmuramate dehydrogenase [Gemmatimonadota bacterium]